jgi:nitroreductase
MKTIDRSQLLTQLNWRYATKQYDRTRKISADDWATLEETLILSPSSMGLQPWAFLVVDDSAVRAELTLASYGQPQIVDASHIVVFATKTNLNDNDVDAHVRRTAEVRGIAVESLAGLRTMASRSIVHGMSDAERRVWAGNQAYIALGNLVTSAALLGIDATPMEGFEKERYNDILGLRQRGFTAVVVVALGYRAAEDKYATIPKVRFAREQVILHV